MRSTKLELASIGAFPLIVAGFGFCPTDESAWGRGDDKSNPQDNAKAVGPRKES
jgi:hypothetical protein